MVVAVLALVGLFDALYLLAHNLGLIQLICGTGGCGVVQASRWSRLGPVPVAAIGVAGYVALLTVALAGLSPERWRSGAIAVLLLAGSAAGVAFTAWLTYLEAYVIHAWCQWCLVSAGLITLIFLASLPEAARIGART